MVCGKGVGANSRFWGMQFRQRTPKPNPPTSLSWPLFQQIYRVASLPEHGSLKHAWGVDRTQIATHTDIEIHALTHSTHTARVHTQVPRPSVPPWITYRRIKLGSGENECWGNILSLPPGNGLYIFDKWDFTCAHTLYLDDKEITHTHTHTQRSSSIAAARERQRAREASSITWPPHHNRTQEEIERKGEK